MLASARLVIPSDIQHPLNSVGETQIYNMKPLYSVFIPVVISGSICFGLWETSADNLARGKNLLNSIQFNIIAGRYATKAVVQLHQRWVEVEGGGTFIA